MPDYLARHIDFYAQAVRPYARYATATHGRSAKTWKHPVTPTPSPAAWNFTPGRFAPARDTPPPRKGEPSMPDNNPVMPDHFACHVDFYAQTVRPYIPANTPPPRMDAPPKPENIALCQPLARRVDFYARKARPNL